MDVTELTDYVHKRTRTDSTVYSDTDVLRELNLANVKITHRVLDKATAFNFSGEIATADTKDYRPLSEGDQGYQGKYKFPTDLLRILRVEIMQNSIYEQIKQIDIDAPVRELTDTYGSFYSVFRNIIRISPKPVVSVPGGLKIWYEKRQPKLSNPTDVPQIDEDFHQILALEATRAYFIDDPTDQNIYRKDAIEGQLAELYSRLDKYYATKSGIKYQLIPKHTNYGS